MNGNYRPYPLNAFTPIMRSAADCIMANVLAPDAIVGMSILTAISTVCQSQVDVLLPTGQKRPVSMNLLTIAGSGLRKSSVDRMTMKAIYDHDADAVENFDAIKFQYEADLAIWKATLKGLNKKLAAEKAQEAGDEV